MLQLDRHQVTEASNGAEALTLFAMGDFDLVITDLQMPVMAGNELAVSIKGLAPTLPILMITASEWARGGADNPVDALLNKPVTVSDLRCALGELLSAPPDPVRDEAGWVHEHTMEWLRFAVAKLKLGACVYDRILSSHQTLPGWRARTASIPAT